MAISTDSPGHVSRLSAWAAMPFSTQMNLWGWILFTAFVVTIAFLWTRVMRHIVQE